MSRGFKPVTTHLSLPPAALSYFRSTLYPSSDIHVGQDPQGRHVGSGGGVLHLLETYFGDADLGRACQESETHHIVINAGGESRRLPAYAPYGKVLAPLPIMKWSRGQAFSQRLLDLQRDYLERLLRLFPSSPSLVVVASGDVLITLPQSISLPPMADIVCLGLRADPKTVSNHGVFVTSRENPLRLEYMLQKPPLSLLEELPSSQDVYVDSGVWVLSPVAIQWLTELSKALQENGERPFDLYTDAGAFLGATPRHEPLATTPTPSVAVWPLEEACFFHFGTTRELLSSTQALQRLSVPREAFLPTKWKDHGDSFVLNSEVALPSVSSLEKVWIENCYLPSTWHLEGEHVLTGIPSNTETISLPRGTCIDLFPVRDRGGWCLRVYGYNDTFRGDVTDPATRYLGCSLSDFISQVGLPLSSCEVYDYPLFPVVDTLQEVWSVLRGILSRSGEWHLGRTLLSPRDVLSLVDLSRVEEHRRVLGYSSLRRMIENHSDSAFFQSDLSALLPSERGGGGGDISSILREQLPDLSAPEQRMHAGIYLSRSESRGGESSESSYRMAYESMMALLSTEGVPSRPLSWRGEVHHDEIVWARCPVRIDLAGGWTDTPPYCLYKGGSVVNLAAKINGQEPLQVYLKRSKRGAIVLRSIDLGCEEVVESVESLMTYNRVGSPFSIPKAALVLVGLVDLYDESGGWSEMIEALGGGLELTMLSALPAGSGLGVSSILAATTLGALNAYFSLSWTLHDIGHKTLLLEQLLTTCGGWQDQFGGIFGGVKSITTSPGAVQRPAVEWLSPRLFTENEGSHLLLYTGITRVAKGILSGIVDHMLLNHHATLTLLDEMKAHAHSLASVLSQGEYERFARMISTSWAYNQALDPGTTTPEVEGIISEISDYALGYKLTGAGGGGFMYIAARDPEAAQLLRRKFEEGKLSLPRTARFVDLSVSDEGLQVTKS